MEITRMTGMMLNELNREMRFASMQAMNKAQKNSIHKK